ncbi:HupE/UreJ family protein [Rubellimicrobium arenae]|uniref:HupE/UreJ family protein n=1 Tax=Rubellimicrobium arenae TaxID=2817372 RepID=UPI001B307EE3|nr:HupE/UreJ family protein [Rubellimicrobium arenae]
MKRIVPTTLLALLATPALAHPGHGATGLAAGLVHPLWGADHLLAMLAVGLWSGFVLPRRVWAGAAAFLTAMSAGAGLSWAGFGLPGVEGLTLASVVAFGLMVLVSRRGQAPVVTAASLAAIAGFALAHGYAHASETAGQVGTYLGGFLISTAALHLAGIGLARIAAGRPFVQRALGASLMGSGLLLAALG